MAETRDPTLSSKGDLELDALSLVTKFSHSRKITDIGFGIAKKFQRLFFLMVLGTAAVLLYYHKSMFNCVLSTEKCSCEVSTVEDGKIRIGGVKMSSPVASKPGLHYEPGNMPIYKSFADAVKARADKNKLIILSSLDAGYVDMALNLWETSFVKFQITNFLFVCTDEEAVVLMHKKGVPCYLGYKVKSNASDNSDFGTAIFKEKTHIKTKIVLDAMELGYDVIIVDVDIVFLKNPIPYFVCPDCDIQYQDDSNQVNSGFYYVRPTKPAVKLHLASLELANKSRDLSNQQCINRIFNTMRKEKTIKDKVLDREEFPRGYDFFEKSGRMFSDDPPCEKCVIAHNNWIVGAAVKIYRFKELGMWMIDSQGYYSSNSTKYILYNNFLKVSDKNASRNLEIETLKVALAIGKALNRKVILPAFHCDNNPSGRCRLNTFIKIKIFNRNFSNSYREHMFLKHPKVPQAVKDSLSPVYQIESSFTSQYKGDTAMKRLIPDKIFNPKGKDGASRDEILGWFDNNEMNQYKVLRFHSLYHAYQFSEDPSLLKSLTSSFRPP